MNTHITWNYFYLIYVCIRIYSWHPICIKNLKNPYFWYFHTQSHCKNNTRWNLTNPFFLYFIPSTVAKSSSLSILIKYCIQIWKFWPHNCNSHINFKIDVSPESSCKNFKINVHPVAKNSRSMSIQMQKFLEYKSVITIRYHRWLQNPKRTI